MHDMHQPHFYNSFKRGTTPRSSPLIYHTYISITCLFNMINSWTFSQKKTLHARVVSVVTGTFFPTWVLFIYYPLVSTLSEKNVILI